MEGIIFIVLLIILFVIGVPIAFSLGITAVTLMFISFGKLTFASIPQMMISGVNTFTLLAVPLFLLAGKLMNTGGITDRLFKFATTMVGFLPGGLGHVNVVASVIFSGMSGTAVSDAGGLGMIEIRAMREHGFDNEFACSVTAASSTIGPIIPPSLPMVIYGMLASASVGTLFIAGIIPGLFMALIMMLVVTIYAKKRKYPREKVPTFREFLTSLRQGILPLITPLIIIIGIYSGIFTPTEAAVVVVFYALFLSFVVYKEMTMKKLYAVLQETVRDSAVIGLIVGASALYGSVIIRAMIPQAILETVTASITSPLVMLLILNLFLLIVGCFLETVSAITILMPLIFPLLVTTGIDPIHFGVIMVLNLMIGVITPPFGLVMFVISKIGDISVTRLSRVLLPWIGALLFALLILTIFPQITLFLPKLLGMI
ncbi:MAG: TRAP transporter large permease [Clostridia bacterium]|nr:TRAP transporter large permease [Clostridia bacterium]